jgi:HEAT repeat protein
MYQAVTILEATLRKNPGATDLAPLLAASYANLGRRKQAHAALRAWRPEASDHELQIAFQTYHFPYKLSRSQRDVTDRLRKGLLLAGIPEYINVADLIENLQSSNVPDRIDAAKMLAQFGELAADAVPVLIEALRHENKALRKNAIITLGEIGPPAKAALPALEALLDKKIATFPVRRAIRNIRGF